jgi:lysozyme family protein
MMNDFDTLVSAAIAREGGFVDHPADRGSATNMGITQAVYDQWRIDQKLPTITVRLITQDEVTRIYFRNYWMAARCPDVPDSVRDIHFDSAINHGVNRAIKLLQTACGTPADGIVGKATIAALAAISPDLLRARYINARYRFYGDIVNRDRTQLDFIVGWLQRMENFH